MASEEGVGEKMRYAALAVKRLGAAVCVFRPYAAKPNRRERVSRRGPRRGSGAGLDAGASGDYLAWPSKDGKPQRPDAGQGSGPRACLPPTPPRPWEAFHCGPPPAAQSPTSDRCPPAGRSAHHQRLTASKEPEVCGFFAKRRVPGKPVPCRGRSRRLPLPPGGWRCGKGETSN